MQEATRNQLSNVSNPFQGKTKRVLCDEIVFVDGSCKTYLSEEDWSLIWEWNPKTITLDIPDEYNWDEEELQSLCLSEYVGRNQ